MQGPGGVTIGEIKAGECFCERRLLEVGPNEETVEAVSECKLYRFRTKPFLALLPAFPGFYDNMIKVSWKRVAEWEHGRRPGGNIKNVGNMPFRWNQLAGPAYHTHSSNSLRCEIDTDAFICGTHGMHHILEEMRGRRQVKSDTNTSASKEGSKSLEWPPKIHRWGTDDLLLNTKFNHIKPDSSLSSATLREDWWKDRCTRDQADRDATLGAIGSTQQERFDSFEKRASALAWRKQQMSRLGMAMVNSIK